MFKLDLENEEEPESKLPTSIGGLVAKSSLTLVTPWTTACQAPLFMRFSRQEHWSFAISNYHVLTDSSVG